MTARDVIELLRLEAHPAEGSFFRETYRSRGSCHPGSPFAGERALGTAIYYLLTSGTCSAMHRLPGDEIFHFYLGDPVEMLMLHPDGSSEIVVLGPDLGRMRVQHVVPGGVWQGACVIPGGSWALLGTTMAPGFDYADYETGDAGLLASHPSHRDRIAKLLRTV